MNFSFKEGEATGIIKNKIITSVTCVTRGRPTVGSQKLIKMKQNVLTGFPF